MEGPFFQFENGAITVKTAPLEAYDFELLQFLTFIQAQEQGLKVVLGERKTMVVRCADLSRLHTIISRYITKLIFKKLLCGRPDPQIIE